MIHAYILAVYKNHNQVIRLYQRIKTPDTVFVIHICLNASKEFTKAVREFFQNEPHVYFCKRERATIFRFGIVKAVMNAIETLQKNNVKYDFITSLSGQDYPIKTNDYIKEYLTANLGKEFITYHSIIFDNDEDYKNTLWQRDETFRFKDYWIKLSKKGPLYRFPVSRFIDKPLWNVLKIYLYELPKYIRENRLKDETIQLLFSRIYKKRKTFIKGFEAYGGWAWWSLSYNCSKYMLETFRNTPELGEFFKYSWTPDEMIYQTILLNSTYKDKIVNNDLRAIVYPGQVHSHPRTYTIDDFDFLRNSPQLFARKFDSNFDNDIIDKIDREILNAN